VPPTPPVSPSPRIAAVSPHFRAHEDALRESAHLGPVVDLACGRGRHTLAAAELGLPAIGLDQNGDFLAGLMAAADSRGLPLECVRSDLETEHGIPLAAASCGAILVFRFLFRPLAPAIVEALAPGGLLLFETFTIGQLALGGGPRSREFLLEEGELPALFPELRVASFREHAGDAALASLAAYKI